jgi:hypothetical protein
MAEVKETAMYRIVGENYFTLDSAERKWMNRVAKWKEQFPDDVEILADNGGTSVLAHLSFSRFNFTAKPRWRMSDEEKQRARERLVGIRARAKSRK